ncbi:FBA_3 domain-containing protein, partial [Cephalotus follicularis]
SSGLGLQDLPSGVFFDILLRLPVKFLLQCVCKTWCLLIDNPHFANLHLTSNLAASAEKPQLMAFFSYHKNYLTNPLITLKVVNLDTLSHSRTAELANAAGYFIDFVCFGFICFKDKMCGRQVFLFNPLRGEIVMPPPELGPSHFAGTKVFYGLGFDSTAEICKLVRVHAHCARLGAEVHILGTSSWRATQLLLIFQRDPPCLYMETCIGWCTVVPPDRCVESMIITFDTRKEEFKSTPHPDFPTKRYEFFHLFEWKGTLAMVDFTHWHMVVERLLQERVGKRVPD